MSARIDKTVGPGVLSLDGQDADVDTNAWLAGDDTVVRAGHGADTTIAAEVCRVG